MSNDADQVLSRLRNCVRPVMFDTLSPDAPFGVKGSAFLVGYRGMMCAVTARHVVSGCPSDKLLICPTPNSAAVRWSQFWTLENDAHDVDSTDLCIGRMDFANHSARAQRQAMLVNLDQLKANWWPGRHASRFFTCGFPSDRTEVSYERLEAKVAQVFLAGSYVGEALANGVHTVRVENPLGVDFDGLSGSPVFCMESALGMTKPIQFCGVAIRGTASSRLIHFLEADTVLRGLRAAFETEKPHARARP